jgi:hypothetical protein
MLSTKQLKILDAELLEKKEKLQLWLMSINDFETYEFKDLQLPYFAKETE